VRLDDRRSLGDGRPGGSLARSVGPPAASPRRAVRVMANGLASAGRGSRQLPGALVMATGLASAGRGSRRLLGRGKSPWIVRLPRPADATTVAKPTPPCSTL